MSVVRRRLALVVPNLGAGGGVQAVGRFLAKVAGRADSIDLRVFSLSESSRDPASLRISSPGSWFTGHTTTEGRVDDIPFTHVGAVGGELEFQRYRSRPALTRALEGSDVIQVVCGSAAWANAVIGLGKPVSVHVATRAVAERRRRDAQPRTPVDAWRKAMTSITNRMDDRALRAADAVQVMNPWMLEYVQSINADRKVDIRLLPPGIDAGKFRPAHGDPTRTERVVLCVARLNDARKNLGLLLEAFARLPERLRNQARMVFAGSPPPTETFWQLAGTLGIRDRVEVVDRPEAPMLLRLYQQARVFALPSDEEGFGMVLLEAMACGTPVVATRSGGPDGIVTDGAEGFLVPRGDANAFSERLAQLLENDDLAGAMGARARQTIEQRYDEPVIGRSFIEIWERLGRT